MAAAYHALERLVTGAQRLRARAWRDGVRWRGPAFWFFTDPERTPDPLPVARALPRGCGVVLRHFGRPEAIALAEPLAEIARVRGLSLLIAADPQLAEAVGADGVHVPERIVLSGRAAGSMVTRRRPEWIITAAAHGVDGATAARRARVDAVFISPVFPSRSPSASRPLGPWQADRIARTARLPAFALGGVTPRTLGRLHRTRMSGVAAIEAVQTAFKT